jgi:hypothetical protein
MNERRLREERLKLWEGNRIHESKGSRTHPIVKNR